jgi:hypothetical protein
MGLLAAIARFLFGPVDGAPRAPIAEDLGGDANVERIRHSVYYGRVRTHRQSAYIPDTLAPLLAWLQEIHSLKIEAIFLENHKSPTATIVMDGVLPMAELVSRFPASDDLRYGEGELWSMSAYTSVQGKA